MSTELPPALEVISDRAARLAHERKLGESSIARGAVLLLSIPLIVLVLVFIGAGFNTLVPWLLAGAYVVVGGAAGITMLGMGILRARTAAKQLERLEAERIPAARLLEE